MTAMGANRYGKDGIRLVLVRRDDPDRHELRDLTVGVRLAGDFTAVHTDGDNAPVLPTDTMRSTVYALAQDHLTGSIEDFGRALGERFLDASPAASVAQVRLEEHGWAPVEVDGRVHGHAFARRSDERATAVVRADRAGVSVTSGITGLVLLKTTGSAFSGFLRDEFTVLQETEDRILATELTASWDYEVAAPGEDLEPDEPAAPVEVDYDESREAVRRTLLETFADHESRSVQHTLYALGEAVLARRAEISRIRLALPNKHHVAVDLSPFGIANANAVFVATDRPFGVIEGTVER